MFNKMNEKTYKKVKIVHKFPYIYLWNIQMFKRIHEKTYKNVEIFHNITNSLEITDIHMKTCTSHAKLYKNCLHSTKKILVTHAKL